MPDTEKISDIVFCPDIDNVQIGFLSLLPRGRAWGTRESLNTNLTGTVLRKFVRGLSGSWMNFEDSMCQTFNEWYCSTSLWDLNLWNIDYGIPDECDLYNMDVCSKVGAIHGISADELTSILLQSGYNCEGRWLTGNDLEFPGVRSTFRIIVDPRLSSAVQQNTKLPHPLHRKLGTADPMQVKCMLERYIPLHTVADVVLSGQWSPNDLGAKLIVWFHADDTNDGNVTSWVARKGGLTATVPAGMTAPTSDKTEPGGYRFVRFGPNQCLRSASLGSIPIGADPGAFAVLAKQIDAAGGKRHVFSVGTNATNRRISRDLVGGVSTPIGAAQGTELVETDQDWIGYGVVYMLVQPTDVSIRIRGLKSNPDHQNISGLNTTLGTGITIGASGNTTPDQFWLGGARHVMALSGDLTSAEYAKLEAWLAWDINDAINQLPPYHPYANMRP